LVFGKPCSHDYIQAAEYRLVLPLEKLYSNICQRLHVGNTTIHNTASYVQRYNSDIDIGTSLSHCSYTGAIIILYVRVRL